MNRRKIAVLVLLTAASASAWLPSQGCGGSGSSGGQAAFDGNVSEVTFASIPQSERSTRFAGLRSLGDWLLPRAVAAPACPTGIEDLLACGVGLTMNDLFFNCTPIDVDTCTFSTRIRVPGNGIATLAFADDVNGNGRPDDGEPGAFPDNGVIPFEVCSGDEIAVTDASIDFTDVEEDEEFGTWTAGNVEKLVDGCSPTATPTPTLTAVPATATPTATPDPTATPTETPGPS